MESQKLKLQSKMTVHHIQAFQAVFEYVPTPLASGSVGLFDHIQLSISSFVFEYVLTSLASGGVGLFVDESLDLTVLEMASNEAFQALWIEFSFIKNKNILCGIIYRQHNPSECFQSYFK